MKSIYFFLKFQYFFCRYVPPGKRNQFNPQRNRHVPPNTNMPVRMSVHQPPPQPTAPRLAAIKNMSMHETRTFSIIYFFLYDYIYNLIFVINKKQFIFVFVSATSLNTKFSFSVVLHIYVRNIYLSIFLCYAILVAITPSYINCFLFITNIKLYM
jgi:hypothetical protein